MAKDTVFQPDAAVSTSFLSYGLLQTAAAGLTGNKKYSVFSFAQALLCLEFKEIFHILYWMIVFTVKITQKTVFYLKIVPQPMEEKK